MPAPRNWTLEKIRRNCTETPRGCWEWNGTLQSEGYGQVCVNYRRYRVHRLTYLLAMGDPGDLFVLHRCDHPPCCNPDHLFLGTARDNTADMDRKGRRVNSPHIGSEHGMALLTEDQVCEIRRRYRLGRRSQHGLAADYDVSRSAICAIVTGRNWRHI